MGTGAIGSYFGCYLIQLCYDLDSSAKASQLTDLQNGRPLELEYVSGAIHRFGQELGVPTPVHSTVYTALKPFALGARANLASGRIFT